MFLLRLVEFKKKFFVTKVGLDSKRLLTFRLKTKNKRRKWSINKETKKRICLEKKYLLLKKKIKIKNQLSLFLKENVVNLKMNEFLKSNRRLSRSFRVIYKKVKKKLLEYKLNFFNKQFNEIYAVLSFGVFFLKAKSIVQLFSKIIGYTRFRYIKKTVHYIFNLISTIQKFYSTNRRIRLNISGKFKGKAKRTQLKYIKTQGILGWKTFDQNLIDFHVGYVATSTGIFGIKL